MAHDGSSALNEFAFFSDEVESDLSVTGKLSLSTAGAHKPVALGDTSHADILSTNSSTHFDYSAPSFIATTASAGHVESVSRNFDIAPVVTHSFAAPAAVVADSAPAAAGTLQTLANYLTDGYWNDSGRTERWFNVAGNGNVIYYNVSGFTGTLLGEADSDGLTAARQTMAREAFKLYSAVLGINFVETTSSSTNVDIFFADNTVGKAYEKTQVYAGTGGDTDYAVINIDDDWYSGYSNVGGVNAYTFQTFIHEIGHALGLGHQGQYNAGSGSPTYANSAQWANDSWQQSLMSYWSQTENTEYSDDSYAQLVTPMAVDWIALNALYAGQGYGTANAFTGNTVYGVGTNISTATSTAFANLATYAATNAFTIVDGSGTDTVDFSNYNANQSINLYVATAGQTHAYLSSVGGLTKNMTIAVGVVIENATAGGGNDSLYGNDANNVLTGNAGNDYLTSYGGNDAEYGGNGNDTLYGGTGNNSQYGGDGNDYLVTSSNNDYMSGGAGTDTMYGGAGTDTMWSYDSVGVNNKDLIYGGDNNDYVYVGSGAETVDGGAGTDTLYQVYSSGDYVFDMTTGATNHSGEVFTNFEIVSMGSGNDSVTGASGLAETIYGGTGNDTINPGNSTAGDVVYGGNGDDSILSGLGTESMYGGTGIDVIDHRAWNGAYTFDMGTGLTNFGGELYTGFEIAYMGNGDNTVTGSANNDTIYGGTGNDTINDGAGNDSVYGGDGNDSIQAGDTTFIGDSWFGGNGTDTLSYATAANWGSALVTFNFVLGTATYSSFSETFSGFEIFQGSAGDDVVISDALGHSFYGNAGNDSMVSALGDEMMYGGDGIDTIDHTAWAFDYTFDMGTGLTQYGGELYQGFEVAYMGAGNDSVTGTTGAETIYGGAGNDTINDGSGNDSVYGGDGNDLIQAGDSSFVGDSWFGGTGVDTLSFTGHSWGTPSSPVVFDFVAGTASYSAFVENFSGFEVFQGSQGDETIISDGNSNSFYGNDGNDSMVASAGLQFMYGGNGIDTLDMTANDANRTFTMWSGSTNTGSETYQGFEVVYMGDGNDLIAGSNFDNTIYGGLGDDTIKGLLSTTGDHLFGGDGNDRLFATAGAATLDGGSGIDTLDNTAINTAVTFDMSTGVTNIANHTYLNFEVVNMGAGNDVVTGSAGNDTIYGNGGNDTLYGGLGVDNLFGYAGNDYFRYVSGQGYDNIYGGADVDTMVFEPFFGDPLTIDMLLGTYNAGGPVFAFVGMENVTTSTGNDLIQGNNKNNNLELGDGNDTAAGGQGIDNIYGGTGNDMLNGGTENDVLGGGAGNDTLSGDDGFDVLYGAAGNDLLVGGNGSDTIYGGADSDTLTGGLGADSLSGGAGNDHFVFEGTSFGVDRITDFTTAGVTDVIDFTALVGIANFADLVSSHLSLVGGNAVVTLGASTLTLVGILPGALLSDDFLF